MGNETPGTPGLSETELRGMPIDALRERARQEGVGDADELRHEELVDAISAKYRSGWAGDGSGGSGGSSGGGASGGGDGNQTPGTPGLSETELRGMPIDALRERARQEGVGNADELRHEELVDAISERHRRRG